MFQVGVVDTGLENVFTVGCATAKCQKGSVTPDGLNVLECCDGDRCLSHDGTNGAWKLGLTWTLLATVILIKSL